MTAWLLHPVPGWPVSQRFGERPEVYAKYGFPDGHEGVDWAAPVGTPVRAAADGQIVTVQASPETAHPYGVFLRVSHQHADVPWVTIYAHLSRIADGLAVGARVDRGQGIGWTGNTGRSSGPHLHFSVRLAGRIVDPEPFLLAEEEETEPG